MAIPNDPHRKLLRQSADRRAIGFLVAASALYLAHWLTGAHWLLLPSVLFTISACVVKHNHIHTSTFGTPPLNHALNIWLAVLTGTSTTGIRIAHNQRHHRSSQSPEDFVRCSLVQKRSAWAAFFCFFPFVVAQTWAHAARDAASLRRRSAPLHRLLRLERAAIWTVVASLCWLDPVTFLWVVPAPWLIGQWFLVTINLLQHDGLDAGDELHQSRNFVGAASNWLFLNNGYHTAHHLRPALHWSRLPEIHRREIAPRLSPGIDSPSLPGLLLDWLQARQRRASGCRTQHRFPGQHGTHEW